MPNSTRFLPLDIADDGDSLWASVSPRTRLRAAVVAAGALLLLIVMIVIVAVVVTKTVSHPKPHNDIDGYTLPLLMPASPWLSQATVPQVASAMAAYICPLLGRTVLESVNASLTPETAVAARDQVWLFRAVLDLYPFAWACGTSSDPWTPLRSLLDDGYELLGFFKDLGVINALPTSPEYIDRLVDVLIWKQQYAAVAASPQHCLYAINGTVDIAQLHCPGVKKRKLSDQYWGLVNSGSLPCDGCLINQTGSGVAIARTLMSSVLQLLLDAAPEFLALDFKHNTSDHDKFEILHDYKKRVRSVIWLPTRMIDTNALFNSSEATQKGVSESFATLTALYLELNDVKDALVAWELYETRSSRRAAAALKRCVVAWDKLLRWWVKSDPVASMHQLQGALAFEH